MRTSIILMGASGVGKTTLARKIEDKFDYKYIKAPTREFEEQFGGRDKINSDMKLRHDFQKEYARKYSRVLEGVVKFSTKTPFIAERSIIDVLMYEAVYGGDVRDTLDVAALFLYHYQNWTRKGSNIINVMLTHDEAYMRSDWDTDLPLYYKKEDVIKQEAVLEAFLRIWRIDYTKIQRHQIPQFLFHHIQKEMANG